MTVRGTENCWRPEIPIAQNSTANGLRRRQSRIELERDALTADPETLAKSAVNASLERVAELPVAAEQVDPAGANRSQHPETLLEIYKRQFDPERKHGLFQGGRKTR